MQKVRPKKSIGQHFLTDKNIALKIVDSLTGEGCRTVLEIGPGMGVLTEYLITRHAHFKAAEIDSESILYLQQHFPQNDFIIAADILKLDFAQFDAPLALIGNLPYYISSQIFFKVLENYTQVNEVVCMIQKEVAERIAAPPGSKTYGILSVLLQTWYDIDYLFTVHEHCFNPPPKVKSAVIRLTRNQRNHLTCNHLQLKAVVKQAFNQRRKTLRNSLKNICINLQMDKEMMGKRPEQLSVEEFIELTQLIYGSKTE